MKEQLSRRERKQNLFSFKSERFVAATPETVLTRFCTPEDIKKNLHQETEKDATNAWLRQSEIAQTRCEASLAIMLFGDRIKLFIFHYDSVFFARLSYWLKQSG